MRLTFSVICDDFLMHGWLGKLHRVQSSIACTPSVHNSRSKPIVCFLGLQIVPAFLHVSPTIRGKSMSCRDFKPAIQGAFFTDRQFNYQLTADEARRLCEMFSKSATNRLYQVSTVAQPATNHLYQVCTVAQPVLDCNQPAISNTMHCMLFRCSGQLKL